MTEDSEVDTRDLRDPATLGQALLDACYNYDGVRWHMSDPSDPKMRVDVPLSIMYDKDVRSMMIPNFDGSQSTVNETVAAYMRKQQNLAAQGNLASVRVLLDKGWPLPDDMDQATVERAREMQSADAEVI